MVDKLFALLVEFASKHGRWPLLLILIFPMLFFFVQEYFGLTFRDTVQNWLLWVGIGFTIITLGFAFLSATLGSAGKLGRLWAPAILITVGAAIAFSGYEKGKAISLTGFVDQEHQQIVQALTKLVPDTLNGDDNAQVLLGDSTLKEFFQVVLASIWQKLCTRARPKRGTNVRPPIFKLCTKRAPAWKRAPHWRFTGEHGDCSEGKKRYRLNY